MFSTVATPRNTRGTTEFPRAFRYAPKKLYRATAGIPQKIRTRYSRVMDQIRRGIRIHSRIRSTPSRERTVSRAATKTTSKKEAQIPFSRPSRSCLPKHRENTTPLPIHSPNSMEVRKVIRANAAPTAARASEPA